MNKRLKDMSFGIKKGDILNQIKKDLWTVQYNNSIIIRVCFITIRHYMNTLS